MSWLGHAFHDLIFGPDPKEPTNHQKGEWRKALHEHRNVAQISSAEAKKSERKSSEALKTAQSAITILESTKKKIEDKSDD